MPFNVMVLWGIGPMALLRRHLGGIGRLRLRLLIQSSGREEVPMKCWQCQNTRLSCTLKMVTTRRSEPAYETTRRWDHRGRPRTCVLVIRFL